MLRPDIVEPSTIKDALQALSRPGAVPLAGATDLIPALRKGEIKPRLLVNLKQLPDASGIRRTRAGIRIGALTPLADLLESKLIAKNCPLLIEVARDFGSPQIRSLATVGGNLCNAAPSADLRASAEYRRDMTATLAKRVLQQALRRAKQKERAR
jgi:CO/xanthine dehydrogenase FAD-binding subunit